MHHLGEGKRFGKEGVHKTWADTLYPPTKTFNTPPAQFRIICVVLVNRNVKFYTAKTGAADAVTRTTGPKKKKKSTNSALNPPRPRTIHTKKVLLAVIPQFHTIYSVSKLPIQKWLRLTYDSGQTISTRQRKNKTSERCSQAPHPHPPQIPPIIIIIN